MPYLVANASKLALGSAPFDKIKTNGVASELSL
jgi:hypothetical protein